MFTGLVEEQGTIRSIESHDDSIRVTVDAVRVLGDVGHGDSISVSGVCLTVVDFEQTSFTTDVMAQTLAMSTLGSKEPGDQVNLERAVAGTTRLGGHIVQGHIDGTAQVVQIRPSENWRVVRFSVPDELAPLLVDKGSITVDGVSLTLSAVSAPQESAWFEVSLIPETLTATTLGALRKGDNVNIETDILARHVARLMSFTHPTNQEGSR